MGEAKRRQRWRRETVEGQRQAMREDLARATRLILARQGPAAFEITERATALHEAGHAVVGVSLAGLVPVSMSLGLIRDGDEGSLLGLNLKAGLCTYPRGSRFNRALDVRVEQPEEMIENAAYRLAGQAAEALCDWQDYRLGSSLDEQLESEGILLAVAAYRLGLPERSRPALILLTRAGIMNILSANKAAIERTAAALIARRNLDQVALADLLADVEGTEPPLGEWVLAQVQDCIAAAPGGDVAAMMQDMGGGTKR